MRPISKEDLVGVFNQYNVISIDIFDTILMRNTGSPLSIFALRGKRFYVMRIFAERAARVIGKIQGKNEINLFDIYRWLPFDDYNVELSLEYEAARANYPLLAALNEIASRGKVIIFVSDMYLPEEFVMKLIGKIGYKGTFQLFLSSSRGTTKSSELFQVVLDELNCLPNEIVHLGDNFISDYLAPRRFGIHSVHWDIRE